jgi:hypothetical protein
VPADARNRSRTAGVNEAGETVALIVACSCRVPAVDASLGPSGRPRLIDSLPATKVGKINQKALRADIALRLATSQTEYSAAIEPSGGQD